MWKGSLLHKAIKTGRSDVAEILHVEKLEKAACEFSFFFLTSLLNGRHQKASAMLRDLL